MPLLRARPRDRVRHSEQQGQTQTLALANSAPRWSPPRAPAAPPRAGSRAEPPPAPPRRPRPLLSTDRPRRPLPPQANELLTEAWVVGATTPARPLPESDACLKRFNSGRRVWRMAADAIALTPASGKPVQTSTVVGHALPVRFRPADRFEQVAAVLGRGSPDAPGARRVWQADAQKAEIETLDARTLHFPALLVDAAVEAPAHRGPVRGVLELRGRGQAAGGAA